MLSAREVFTRAAVAWFMTISEVRVRVKEVAKLSTDHERAHSAEDQLYLDVLRAIAEGHPDAARLARAALATQLFVFPRYCA